MIGSRFKIVANFTLLFLFMPICALVFLSISRNHYLKIDGITFNWIIKVFQSNEWRIAFLNSIIIAFLATFSSLFMILLALDFLRKSSKFLSKVIRDLVVSVLVVPIVILAISCYLFLNKIGITDSIVGLVLAHCLIILPVSMLLILNGVERFSKHN